MTLKALDSSGEQCFTPLEGVAAVAPESPKYWQFLTLTAINLLLYCKW